MADSFSLIASLAPRALPWLGKFATIAILALLAWLGASLFWNLTVPATPEPAIVVDTDPSTVAQMIAARHLFGEAPAQGAAGAVATSVANIKLHGVVAPARRGQIAIAILSSQGKPAVAVRVGEEILPGVTLHRVLPRSVEIDQGGQIRLLTLPERGKT
jgi:general secretion pathway protein C